MKIAVLLSGQARHLEAASYWWRERVFPKTYKNIEVDYYAYIWDDGSDNLKERIQRTFDPVRYFVGDYNVSFHSHRHKIRKANQYATDWNLINKYCKHLVCYKGEDFDRYAYNFPGQYLASAAVTKMVGNLEGQYDVVIKTRTDCAFNTMEEKHWLNLFGNMNKNPVFNDCIFSPWMRIRNGYPFFSDLSFFGKPRLMYDYFHNMDQHLYYIATGDKYLLSDTKFDDTIPIPHWMWSRLSMYSKTDWLALSVVWPTPFDCALIRSDEDLSDKDFAYIKQQYEESEKEKHQSFSHIIGEGDK